MNKCEICGQQTKALMKALLMGPLGLRSYKACEICRATKQHKVKGQNEPTPICAK